jgi:hypothetical protein
MFICYLQSDPEWHWAYACRLGRSVIGPVRQSSTFFLAGSKPRNGLLGFEWDFATSSEESCQTFPQCFACADRGLCGHAWDFRRVNAVASCYDEKE